MNQREKIENFYEHIKMGLALAGGLLTLTCAEIATYPTRLQYSPTTNTSINSIDEDRLYRWMKIECGVGATALAGIALTRLAKKRKLEELTE